MRSLEQTVSNWTKGLSNARANYEAGIMAFDGNPMQLAAAKADQYVSRVQDAVRSGKWQRGLLRVTPETWKQRAIKIGGEKLVLGAQRGRDKFNAFMQRFLPHLQSGVARVRSMPNGTYEERRQRALAMMDHNHQFASQGTVPLM